MADSDDKQQAQLYLIHTFEAARSRAIQEEHLLIGCKVQLEDVFEEAEDALYETIEAIDSVRLLLGELDRVLRALRAEL